jgi:hypothetical protein
MSDQPTPVTDQPVTVLLENDSIRQLLHVNDHLYALTEFGFILRASLTEPLAWHQVPAPISITLAQELTNGPSQTE